MNEINVVKESFVFPTKHLPKCFSNLSLYDKLDDIYNSYNGIEEILSDNFVFTEGKIKDFKGYKDNVFGLKKVLNLLIYTYLNRMVLIESFQ